MDFFNTHTTMTLKTRSMSDGNETQAAQGAFLSELEITAGDNSETRVVG